MITEPPVVRACCEGSGIWYRTSVEVGDIIMWPGARWYIMSQEDVKRYYDAVGIELWGFPSTWEDCPRKPKVRFTTDPAYRYPYGTFARMNGTLFRFLGGDWWEYA